MCSFVVTTPFSATGLLALCLLASGTVAQADAIWLERTATGASAHLGDALQRTPSLPPLLAPRAFLSDGKDLPLTMQADHLAIALESTSADLRLHASQVSSKGVLIHYQAKAGRQDTRAVNDLELVPTTPGGSAFLLMWKGQAVAATQVNVDTSAGWHRTLAPAADGTVQLDIPFPGVYVLEVSAKVNGAVTVEGKKYDNVRHTATLSFEVPR